MRGAFLVIACFFGIILLSAVVFRSSVLEFFWWAAISAVLAALCTGWLRPGDSPFFDGVLRVYKRQPYFLSYLIVLMVIAGISARSVRSLKSSAHSSGRIEKPVMVSAPAAPATPRPVVEAMDPFTSMSAEQHLAEARRALDQNVGDEAVRHLDALSAIQRAEKSAVVLRRRAESLITAARAKAEKAVVA